MATETAVHATQTATRVRNPEQTLERIVNAALALFGQYGYERTTISAIVEHAGYSKGAFYNHFNSKEELFVHLLERRVKNNRQRVEELYAAEMHPARWLRSTLESLLHAAQTDKTWAALSIEFMVQGMRDERLGRRLALIHQSWRTLIADKLRASEAFASGRMAADPDAVAAVVVALIDGFIIQASMETELLDSDRIDQYVELLIGRIEEN
jgi:AcrR family transcriptional regulator